MKGRRQQTPLLCCNAASVIQMRQCLNVRAKPLDNRSPDEYPVKWDIAERLELKVTFKTIELPTKGVTLRRDVHQRERRLAFRTAFGDLLGEQDHPGTRSPDRHARLSTLADRLQQTIGDQQLADGRA